MGHEGDSLKATHAVVPVAGRADPVAWLKRLVDASDPGDIAALASEWVCAQPGCASARVAWSPFSSAPRDDAAVPLPAALAMVRGRLERSGSASVAFGDALAVRLLSRGRATLLMEMDHAGRQSELLAAIEPWLPLVTGKLERALRVRDLEATQRQMERSEALQRALFAISDLASSELDMAEVLERLHGIVGTLMYAENFFIVRCDPQRQTVRFLYYADGEDTDAPPLNVDEPLDSMRDTLTWHLLTGGRSLMGELPSIRKQLRGGFAPIGPGSVDWLGVPMLREGEVHGALVVQSYREGVRFAEEDRTLLQFVGSHVLTALERKENRDELEERVRRRTAELATANAELQQEVAERKRAERLQSALYHLAQLATAGIDETEFYRRVHAVVGELLNADNFFIALLSGDRKRLLFPYYVDGGEQQSLERELSCGLSEYVLRTGQPLLGMPDDMQALADSGEIDRGHFGPMSQCWLGVPLRVADEVIGLVAVQSYTADVRYDEADKELLGFAALQIASSIHRRRAAATLQHAYADLEQRVADRTRELRLEIEERERIQARLKHDVTHDALTGLPNRGYLRERLNLRLAQQRSDGCSALLYLDVDRFKVINDSLGHLAGDAFLQAIASRLRACVRTPDVVARLAGDEFAILLDAVAETAEAEQVASRVLEALHQPLTVGGRELEPSASIGVALGHAGGQQRADGLLRDADRALYRAKELGRGRYVLFDDSLARSAVDELAQETELRHALTHAEFEPFFQPIYRLGNGAVAGYEALLRWHHPRRGLLLPGEFLRVAQDSGQLEAIDWQLYERVCQRMACADTGVAFVTINVSPQHLRSSDFERRLLHLVERSGLAPERLVIEITEGALLDDPLRVRDALERLRAVGVQAALDDFGTGYSSLSYLHSLPLRMLKIDRAFVSELDRPGARSANSVVMAILALARALGIEVIAEGIETEAQRDTLRSMGCNYAQGFLLARPAPLPPTA